MNSLLHCPLIKKNKNRILNEKSNNRYSVSFIEKNGSMSSIYSAVPIRNSKTNDIIQTSFNNNKGLIVYEGSNSTIYIKKNHMHFHNEKNNIKIILNDNYLKSSKKNIVYQKAIVSPTLNGLLFNVNTNNYDLIVNTQTAFDLRINDRFVSILADEFEQIMTISCLGAYDSDNNFIGISNIKYEKINKNDIKIMVTDDNICTKYFLFEINIFEEKLFQDTTVESRNPYLNNIYGSLAIIENSLQNGEQWLYSKLNMQKLNLQPNKKIKTIKIYYPKHSNTKQEFLIYKLKSTFCSFGTTWDNKVYPSSILSKAKNCGELYCIDITDMFLEFNNKFQQNLDI